MNNFNISKKITAIVLSIIITIGLIPITAMAEYSEAATYEDVNSFAELQQAFEDTAAQVRIIITGNIVNENGDKLTAASGQSYKVEGNGYILTDIIIGGSGNVVIDADLEGENEYALTTKDEVTITVNGNIYGKQHDGIDANDKTKVTVNGNVKSDEGDALDMDDYAEVTVYGDSHGGNGADGIDASDNTKAIVYGDVYGGSGKEPDADGNLSSGNINDPQGYSDGGNGVEADKNAIVYVYGNAHGGNGYGTYAYAGSGIDAMDYAKVSVTGDTVGGNLITNPEVVPDKETDPDGNEYTLVGYTGDGIYMSSTADVTVGGDAIGGDSNVREGVAGRGVFVELALSADVSDEGGTIHVEENKPGQLEVKGSIIGGKFDNTVGSHGSAIYYAPYDLNPAKDHMLPDEIIETIVSSGDPDELRDAIESMAAVVYEAGVYYMDHETRLAYQNKYVKEIIALAAEYGVDTEEAIDSYVPESGSVDTEEIKNLKAVVKAVPDNKVAEFTKKALQIGNEVLASTDENIFVVHKIKAGDIKAQGDKVPVGFDSEFNEQFIQKILAEYITFIHTVTYNVDGQVVSTEAVEHGKDATLPAVPVKEGFVGKWDGDGKSITENTVINAIYTEIPVVKPDEVKTNDKTDLEDTKTKLEEELKDDSYTEDDKKAIQDAIDDIDDALEVIGNVEAVEEAVSKLPAVNTVKPDDEEAIKAITDAQTAYNALSDYEKSLVDEDTKANLNKLAAALVAYDIVEGDGSSWTEDSDQNITFVVNGLFSKFVGIKVDGKDVDKANYEAKAGSTIITLKTSYLDTLAVGEHTITVVYTDGSTDGTFDVHAKIKSPATGDYSKIWLWVALLFVIGGAVITLTVVYRKKRAAKR